LSLDIDPSILLKLRLDLHLLLWDSVFYPILNSLYTPISVYTTLEEIFEIAESRDRYYQILSILDRAKAKISRDVVITKRPKFTMNWVTLALKANKWSEEQRNRRSFTEW
jgi:hypothetical protein